MAHKSLIYLDHAATSYPKPRAVRREVARCLEIYGGNPGRGAHALSMKAAEKVYACRERLAMFFGVEDPERVIFTANTTYALNLALKGLLRQGDHVLFSDMEHNAVWRPLFRESEAGRISANSFRSGAGESEAFDVCEELERAIQPNTRMVVCVYASNICSFSLPIREIAAFCHRHGLLFVVDGAQSAGHLPIRVDEWGIDALCVPGHKGLLGPQGCGALILGREIRPETVFEGGNGVYSLEGLMTEQTPERYEVGTLPTPAIAGLSEGIGVLARVGIDAVAEYEKWLCHVAKEMLGNTEGVRLFAPQYEGPILLFGLEGWRSEEVGARLNEKGICVRSGFHCAAMAHKTLGTPDDGATRVSFGLSNRRGDVDALWRAVRELLAEKR